MITELPPLVDQFARRADKYDRTATFPGENFDDLFAAGLHAPTIPRAFGGLGLGPAQRDTYPLWEMTKRIASADLSFARCWEGHVNSMVLIDALGSEDQKALWFNRVIRHGDRWVAWSGEPQAPKPGEKRRFGTTVRRQGAGWIVNGSKAFATSATGADWAILLVNVDGPGGARHGSHTGVLMLACDLADPSISVDPSWWDPIGMRATVSHVVRFDDTYIPDRHQIGEPGDYLREGWQSAFVPHYAASFLGAAEASYSYAIDYVLKQDKATDPYVQHRIGKMVVAIETGDLLLRHVASLWDTDQRAEAGLAGSRARHLMEHLALDTVDHCVRVCGARSLIRPSPVERIFRDLSCYVRHDNDDHILATIGRAALDQPHDLSFYKP
ncbi:acyl-CoA dehydrogenase family protein [Actinocrispum wychmicini]|uniref:Alkylation response protein AidB-like acyl-CoA dehydrogenase n=1 Tax=Actinocrispum wychmicini TaxID=1213861 RepID=A0A4R2IQG6_9PSEU|nr:acyl-CoA dehydrogenase family protein [Actinocrispum wychmicini]TCO46636.1 alkylation response protein AidB-like acyl-CoA dehydrogenase [Actinocrispum wychmicini]